MGLGFINQFRVLFVAGVTWLHEFAKTQSDAQQGENFALCKY